MTAIRIRSAESDSAAPRDAHLAEGYRRCARITRRHGTTYYWGARLLPAQQRRHVHAIYALARAADDIVDSPGATQGTSVPATTRRLDAFARSFWQAVAAGTSDNPVLAAVVRTIHECQIPPECFQRFLAAMVRDLTVTEYQTWPDLLDYMEGSAAVIGEMMLPVLQPTSLPSAREPARALGLAFQLTNFLRDIGEDLDRGRVYVPQEDLARYRVDPRQRRVDEPWRELMRFEMARNRELYALADTGLRWLPPASARCVSTARRLYSQILERIEANDFDVFRTRARVPTLRKMAVATSTVLAGVPSGGGPR